jgi:hypothetical protein
VAYNSHIFESHLLVSFQSKIPFTQLAELVEASTNESADLFIVVIKSGQDENLDENVVLAEIPDHRLRTSRL